jgi:methionyl aminopeptidase
MSLDYKENFEKIKIAGTLAAAALDEVTSYIAPGITTESIDKICYEFIKDNGGYSAPLFYRGFPKSCCTSVNHVICHGIPTAKYLNEGDIINIDVTSIVNDWHGDTSRMYYVGDVSVKSKKLVDVTYHSMMKGISIIKNGINLGDIGETIQAYAEKNGFSVVRDFCGHGIGKIFHEAPNVLHYGKKGEGMKLKTGMIFTVEPMINEGNYNTKLLKDGWTAVTKDKSLSAQFEHTVGVTDDGFEIFTKSKKKLEYPPYKL